MSSQKVFITGISGSVGHYVFDELIKDKDYQLYLLVRDPRKLKFNPAAFPNVTLVQDDLSNIEAHADLLKDMDYLVHIATGWGGGRKLYEIDYDKTLSLFNLVDPEKCKKVIYFSTASILDSNNQPMPEAEIHGIEYIQAKYRALMEIPKLKIYPKIITLFPTIIFGGDARHPFTHPSAGISEIAKWSWLLRFLKMDASFHFIHAMDIARIVDYLLHHQVSESRYVLGNDPVTIEEAIGEICGFYGKKILFQINLSPDLILGMAKLFGKELLPWDRFSLEYRHFRYKTVNATSFGLPTQLQTLHQILRDYRQASVSAKAI